MAWWIRLNGGWTAGPEPNRWNLTRSAGLSRCNPESWNVAVTMNAPLHRACRGHPFLNEIAPPGVQLARNLYKLTISH
jgi:hypothetical protein